MAGAVFSAVSKRLVLAGLLLTGVWAQEVVLYDASATAGAYIVGDTLSVHLWSGEPVAYLAQDSFGDALSVYSPFGQHLGWFDGGLLWDHQGRIVAFMEGALEVTLGEPPPRGENRFSHLPLLKRPPEPAPLRPLWRYTWSETGLARFFDWRGRH